MKTVKINFINNLGQVVVVDAPVGLSVLEVAHKNGVALEGACEGSLACSTCHVIVEPSYFNKLEAASEAEEDMLDLAFGLSHTSRLGCQIIITPEIEGITFTLPGVTRNMMVDKC